MQIIYLALIAVPVLLAFDLTWVGVVANKYYKDQLGPLFATHIIVWPTILFYVIYFVGLAYFAIAPAVAKHSLPLAAMNGAFLGLIAYGTYDLVNLSTTQGWPLQLSLVDMTWGIVLSSVVSSIVYLIAVHVLHF
jgi:uncharacterized membrane protein